MKPAPARPDLHTLADCAQGAKVELLVEGEWVVAVVSFHGNVRRLLADEREGEFERFDPKTPARRR